MSALRVGFLLFSLGMYCGYGHTQSIIRDDELYYSIAHSELAKEELSLLLEQGLDVDSEIYNPDSSNPVTLLSVAIGSKNEEIAKALIEHGADIYKRFSPDSFSIIHVAILYDMIDLAIWILENRPEYSLTRWQPGYLPLDFAVRKGNERLISLMLDNISGDIKKYQSALDDALFVSISLGPSYTDISHLLIDSGASLEKDINLLLAVALNGGSEEFVNKALRLGADPNAIVYEEPMIMFALRSLQSNKSKASEENLKTLLRVGADPCAANKMIISESLQESLGTEYILQCK